MSHERALTDASRRTAPERTETVRPGAVRAGDSRSSSGAVAALETLQRSAGNRTVAGLLAVAQAKLEVGPAADPYEVEADAVAGQVVTALRSMSGTGGMSSMKAGPTAPEADDPDRALRRSTVSRRAEVGAAGGTLDPRTEAAILSARGGGRPLEGRTRTAMESAFGADFSRVRVHAGPEAADLNASLQATAFTLGNDIFFRHSVPDAGSSEGQGLLAHELTHTIQQGGASTLARSPTHVNEHDAVSRSWAGSCCGEIHADGTVIRRHSSWEHSLLGDAKPADLAKIGAWQDLINQTDKAEARKRGEPAKRIGSVVIDGVGAIDKGQVMHVLVQEMTRLKKWQLAPPKGASTDDPMNKAKEDDEFQVIVVRLPGDGMLVTYGELNTLADFYGNLEQMEAAAPQRRVEIVQSVRKETFLRLREIYDKLNSSLTSVEKGQGPVRDAKSEFKSEKLGPKSPGRENVTFAGAITPDYISGMAGQLELLKGVQGLGTTGAVNQYGAGLARNACHFVPESWLAWSDCHAKAIEAARQSRASLREATRLEAELLQVNPAVSQATRDRKAAVLENKKDEVSEFANKALLHNGFGDHYLQDSYASGHMLNKTRIMQWYVEYIDTTKDWDYFKDANWRKVQQMAYQQEGLSSAGQYDKSKVRGYKPADANYNRPRNPQSVENLPGSDWTVRFTALGLTVPRSLRDPNSAERGVFEKWQEDAALVPALATRTGADLKRAIPAMKNQLEGITANLVADGVVRTDEDVSTRGALMQDKSRGRLTGRTFDRMKFIIRPEYIPSEGKLAEFRKAQTASNSGDDSAYQKMAKAVTYGEYIEFMSSSFIQKATNALHDVFCKAGLRVKTAANTEAFKVYGDDAMFSAESSKGVEGSGKTANMSRDSILSIINSGNDGGNSTKTIIDRLPAYVEYDIPGGATKTDSIEVWHNPNNVDGLKQKCMTEVFPGMSGSVVQKFAPGVISPSLGQITRDNPHGTDAF